MKRRTFFKISTITGGGILMSTFIPFGCVNPDQKDMLDWIPNFYLKISPDNLITFICSQSEIGQGTSTGLSMIVADELGVALEDLQLEFAEGNESKYQFTQDTGGSNGLRLLWEPLRKAMATTREILKTAAAHRWQIPVNDCYTENSMVCNHLNDRKLSFGDLIKDAAEIPAPQEIKLKDKKDFQYIGQSAIGVKTKLTAKGITPFSINKSLPNMVYAAIERCPVWGGQLVSFDDQEARKVKGVLDIFEIKPVEVDAKVDYKGGVRAGVVVVAENTWAAFQAKKLLKINWDLGLNQKRTEKDVLDELNQAKVKANTVSHDFKQGASIYKSGKKTIKADYIIPYQANACMEPLNAVAFHKGYEIDVWAGTQSPKLARIRIAEVSGLPEAAITIHNQPSGGGFGRRFFVDFIEEAVTISEKLRRPVKLTWSREDTIQTSKYHPFWAEYYEAALDEEDKPIAINYGGAVSAPFGFRPYPYSLPMAFHSGVDYQSPRLLPRASWRSVRAHFWGFGLESFIDELAYQANQDPVDYRLALLDKAEMVEQILDPWVGDNLYPVKLKRTLEVAAEKANWGNAPAGRFQGVACIAYNTSYCTQIVEISIQQEKLVIHKFTVVLDCGLVVNPSQAKAQMEGSIIWGLGAVLKPPITLKSGQVVQSNFHDYPMIRMNETPEIVVHLLDSDDGPSGTGEIAVPGVAPAIANAIYAATGKRIRQMPFDDFI